MFYYFRWSVHNICEENKSNNVQIRYGKTQCKFLDLFLKDYENNYRKSLLSGSPTLF